MNKRGISDIVSTVLLVLVTILAVILMWAILSANFENQGGAFQRGIDDILDDVNNPQFITQNETLPPVCILNGILEEGEFCDGNNFGNLTCADFGFDSGNLVCNSQCQITTASCFNTNELSPPSFAIELIDGTFRSYQNLQDAGNFWTAEDELIESEIRFLGSHIWEIQITSINSNVRKVWFPWEADNFHLGSSADDDVIYYPEHMGVMLSASGESSVYPRTGWFGTLATDRACYPGRCFSPLVVLADENSAKMVASANWPPRTVTPRVGHTTKMVLVYHFPNGTSGEVPIIKPGTTETFRSMIVEKNATPENGEVAWQLVLDEYKNWLKPNMQAQEFYPVSYPQWMKDSPGFLHIQTNKGNYPGMIMDQFNITVVENHWNKWKDVFGWMQVWGQMNAFNTGGCCDLKRIVAQDQVVGGFLNLVNDAVSEGHHVSFYQRPWRQEAGQPPNPFTGNYPFFDDPRLFNTNDGTAETQYSWVDEWIDINQNAGTNAYYLDVVGCGYFGEPIWFANLFRNGYFPQGSFIECAVDFYPTAFLAGGSISGVIAPNYGGPGFDEEEALSGLYPKVMKPSFGRYVMDDKIFYVGASNGDWIFWGKNFRDGGASGVSWGNRAFDTVGLQLYNCLDNQTMENFCNYWTERQAFLLGAKFDASMPAINPNNASLNYLEPPINLTIQAWQETNFWNRNLLYRGTKGISNIQQPAQITIFEEPSTGKLLLAVDNYDFSSQINFDFNGQPRTIMAPASSRNEPKEIFIIDNFS